MQSFDRILTVANLNNDKFDHIEKRVMIYTKRRYERENYTLEFQNKIKRLKEKQKYIENTIAYEKKKRQEQMEKDIEKGLKK